MMEYAIIITDVDTEELVFRGKAEVRNVQECPFTKDILGDVIHNGMSYPAQKFFPRGRREYWLVVLAYCVPEPV